MTCDSKELERAATKVVELCCAKGLTVSTAESCTAGLVAASIAAVPGASDILRGGAVTYVNDIKERVLGVAHASIEEYTEVSHPVAREMASGACTLFGTDIAVSLTGYAGPGGGTAENPVGTVYVGIARDGAVDSIRVHFLGDRNEVRRQATLCALNLIASCVEDL